MQTFGHHLLVEYHGCDALVLDDLEEIERLLRGAAEAAGTKVVAALMRPFSPSGVTGVLVLEESHVSIHTWPDHRYAAVDLYTCGDGDPGLAQRVLADGLRAERTDTLLVERGMVATRPSLRVAGTSQVTPSNRPPALRS